MSERSVLITGASTGIGKACALHLVGAGFTVYAGVRKERDGDALQREASDRLKPVILDVTKEETIAEAREMISNDTEHPLHGLVNNAGIGLSGVLEATPESEFRKLLEVNVLGLHAVTRAFLPLLRKSTGRIINIGSSSSFMAGPGISSYAASKFAVRALTDSLCLELKPFGMSVSLVAPGAIESDIWDKAKAYKEELRRTAPPELVEAYALFVKVGDRMADIIKPIPALEVAKAVAHGLTSNRPKQLYLVGADARKARGLSRLPKSLLNWLIMKRITQIAERT
jgi:NAD(P)-dependent dehydrogenase (short-subunit alcohol dehydrogenase family)